MKLYFISRNVPDRLKRRQSVVEDRRKDAHVTSLRSAGKYILAAPVDKRARPQKVQGCFPRKNCGQLPAHLSPSAGRSRKGVPLRIPPPVPTNFVYALFPFRYSRIKAMQYIKICIFNFRFILCNSFIR
jgi:hypothetical protein